jgi:hypothetical protein
MSAHEWAAETCTADRGALSYVPCSGDAGILALSCTITRERLAALQGCFQE